MGRPSKYPAEFRAEAVELVNSSDRSIADLTSLESEGRGHGRPLGATLIKMIDEYALHSGQAHMLRYVALGDVVR